MKIYGTTGNVTVDGFLSAEELHELNSSQLNDATAVRDYWKEHGCGKPYPLVIKPTGYGKGRVIDELLRPNDEPGNTLLVVGTKNVLVEQNQEALRSLVIEKTGESRFSVLPDISGPVIVATWQSLVAFRKNRSSNPPLINLAIIDEVHNTGTRTRISLLQWLAPKRVVGFTATAYRASGIFRTPEHYGFEPIDEITTTLPYCIEKRWLSPLAGICIDTEIVLPHTVVSNGGINGQKLYRELRHHPDLFGGIAREIGTRFLPTGMKTIIVVNRVLEEACVIYKALELMGFKVGLAVNQGASRMLEGAYITNGSIARYKLPPDHPDSLQVLISPQVIGEGFDAPATECLVWAAPTGSSLRYTQVMGRGARRCLGKRYCLIVDFVYQIEGYGYSMNFAQFFKHSEIKELEGGVLYVGPSGSVGVAIPQEFYRGAHIVPIVDLVQQPEYFPANGWLTTNQIAKKIGKTSFWVSNRLDRSQGEMRRGPRGKPTLHFAPEAVDRLRALAQKAPSAGDWVTAVDVAKHVQRSRAWAKKFLGDGAFNSQARLDGSGRAMIHFPPSVLEEAAKKAAEEESAADWLTTNKIAETLDQNFHWTQRSLAKVGATGELRRSVEGFILMHYPPSVIAELKKELGAIPDAEADWMTGRKLATALSKTHVWVKARLDDLGIDGKIARDLTSRQVVEFFPSTVLEVLKQTLETHEDAGDWLTAPQIAERVNRSTFIVNNCLVSLGIQGETRWASNGSARIHYPPDSLQKVRSMSDKAPPADENWLTLTQVAQTLEQSVSWTSRRIKSFSHKAELRRNRAGEISLHYPSAIIAELRKQVEVINHAPPGWLTVGEICTVLHKMKGGTLIPQTLNRLGYKPRVYHNKVNQKRGYYPPEAIDALRKEFAK